MTPAAQAILAVALVSAVPFGVAWMLPRDPAVLQRTVRWLVGFATGALLGTAVLHLIPETFGLVAMIGALVVLGFGSRFTVLATGLVPFAAGGFIYIASADLIPRLNEEAHLTQTGSFSFRCCLALD